VSPTLVNYSGYSQTSSEASLTDLYPAYNSIVNALKDSNSKYGKGYIHSLKYRIIAAIEKDLGENHHTTIVRWTYTWPNTWRNTANRCLRGAAALATLGEQASKGILTQRQDDLYQLLKVLFAGPIRLLPYIPFVDTDLSDRSSQEWRKLRIEKQAVNLASTKLEEFAREVEAWFP
jgi:hypothetical protein